MLEHSQEDHWFTQFRILIFRSFRHKFRHETSGSYRNSIFTFYLWVMTMLLSLTLSIHSPPMDRFASEMLTGLWVSLHRPSLLLLRCQFTHTLSCSHYPLARQRGTALLLGLCSNAISLTVPFPGSGSLLCISDCKAHTSSESFLIAALETSNVSWSPCHLHNAELCIALWNECMEGRCDTSAMSY